MGAVTALMHADAYQPKDVATLVVDSPFSSFEAIAKDMVKKNVKGLPDFVVDVLMQLIRYSCK